MNNFQKGSEWRRWDLHIHTPFTRKNDCLPVIKRVRQTNEEKLTPTNINWETDEHRFTVALSFAGEYRIDIVVPIANKLQAKFDKQHILYDKFHAAEFARGNLDLHLQDLYRNHSTLIVVFIGRCYDESTWCGIEWKAIRALLHEAGNGDRVMFVKADDGLVAGVYGTIDGYVSVDEYGIDGIYDLIIERYGQVIGRLKRQSRYSIKIETTKISSLHGVDKADALIGIANEKALQSDYRAMLAFLLEALDIFIDETGAESSDVKSTISKIKNVYKQLGITQPFDKWLLTARKSR